MEKNNDNLEQSIEILKNSPVPPGPPQQTIDETIERLAQATQNPSSSRPPGKFGLIKLAAAAVLLIVAGFAAGRLSKPAGLPPEQLAQLQASLTAKLEPAVTSQLQQQFSQNLADYVAASNEDFKSQLEEQFDQKLSEFAVLTLTASGTVTKELLEDLVATIESAQQRERLRFASALEQLEYYQLQRDAQLQQGLVQTESEINLTKKGLTSLLAYNFLSGNEIQNQQQQ